MKFLYELLNFPLKLLGMYFSYRLQKANRPPLPWLNSFLSEGLKSKPIRDVEFLPLHDPKKKPKV